MSPDLERLITLQRLELAIAEAKTRIASHPERLAAADARLHAASLAVESAKRRLTDSHDARCVLEKDAAVYQGRLTKFKDQLSAVKTNREYQAMQHEIATAQQELGAVEERVLERMMEGDALAAEVKRAETMLATTRQEVDAEKQGLAEELVTTGRTLEDATAARAAIVEELPKPLVALFEQVARARKGVAICTATRDGLCSVCHVRLRPPVFQQVRHNDTIVQCEVCHRILYYVPPPQPVTPPTTVTS
ncbi:MAG: zinc ribbon domain-containing protein [Vicinamibacterales bacterium]